MRKELFFLSFERFRRMRNRICIIWRHGNVEIVYTISCRNYRRKFLSVNEFIQRIAKFILTNVTGGRARTNASMIHNSVEIPIGTPVRGKVKR